MSHILSGTTSNATDVDVSRLMSCCDAICRKLFGDVQNIADRISSEYPLKLTGFVERNLEIIAILSNAINDMPNTPTYTQCTTVVVQGNDVDFAVVEEALIGAIDTLLVVASESTLVTEVPVPPPILAYPRCLFEQCFHTATPPGLTGWHLSIGFWSTLLGSDTGRH